MRSNPGRAPIAALLGIAGLFAAGCGSQFASPPRTYPVRGKVVLKNGQVPRAGLVSFHPQGIGVEASAELDENGTFVVKTFGEQEGTVPGKYKISINPSWPTARPKDAVAQAKRVVPRKYWSGDTTDIVREVKTEDNVFEISIP